MAAAPASVVRQGANITFGNAPTTPEVSLWASIPILLTLGASAVALVFFHYLFSVLACILTVVEPNEADIPIAMDKTFPKESHSMSKPSSPERLHKTEVLLVKDGPITSSIRGTIRHLRVHYGYVYFFRPLPLYLCILAASQFMIRLFRKAAFMNGWTGSCIANILDVMIFAEWKMTLVHLAMSKPSVEMKWWRRAPSPRAWLRIAPAALLFGMATSIVKISPKMANLGFDSFNKMHNLYSKPARARSDVALAEQAFAYTFNFILAVLVMLPASVIFVRVAASMLPEDSQTVVPFDRSFGGRLPPATATTITTGKQRRNIGLVEAWDSYDWASTIRLLKLQVKYYLVFLAMYAVFLVITIGQEKLFGPENVRAVIKPIYKWLR